jgi:hypothetical protein
MMAKEPDARPASATAVSERLTQLLQASGARSEP